MTHDPSAATGSDRPALLAIAAALVLYGLSAVWQWPQQATQRIVADSHAPATAEAGHDKGAVHVPAAHSPPDPPPLVMVLPFAALLGAIAVLPLVPAASHWWESNLHKLYVGGGLGLATLLYFAVLHPHAVERHFLGHALIERNGVSVSWDIPWTVLQNAIFNEYVPFIALLFSLYAISGGIRIVGDLPAHARTNTAFLAVGGLLASFIGTTGAAMLLIRPLLETNRERKHVRHTVVFFIFIVCNCGGCLLPLGDPPLFLGYLQGVDFLWTLSLWREWLLVNASLLAIYFVWDHFFAYPKEAARDVALDERRVHRLRFAGIWPNAPLLLGVVLAVALLDPSKTLPGTDWHPWIYLREAVLLGLVGLSLLLGEKHIRHENRFSYAAILEVAALFLGIFICMQPALQILSVQGPRLGIDTPAKFFWATGALSSVLDNAPTYLVFFQTAQSLHAGGETMAGVPVDMLAAISLGAVFMGALTYIGNGPNFMVKTIAESEGIRMPSFFGYVLYSVCVLLPLFVLVTVMLF